MARGGWDKMGFYSWRRLWRHFTRPFVSFLVGLPHCFTTNTSKQTNKQTNKHLSPASKIFFWLPLLRDALSLEHSRKLSISFLIVATRQFSLLKVITGLEERTSRHLMRSTLTASLQQKRSNRIILDSLARLFEPKLAMWSKWSLRTK